MFLFAFWLRNMPSIKHVRNWGNGGRVIQIAYRGRGLEKSVIRYVPTKLMVPKNVVEYFLCLDFGFFDIPLLQRN